MRINIKALSVNEAWKGRRFKTAEYKAYEEWLLWELKTMEDIEIPEGKLQIRFIFGVSSKLSDWDNPIKPFQDIVCKHFGFDDRRIYRGISDKVDVDKGDEFIEFSIYSLAENIKI